MGPTLSANFPILLYQVMRKHGQQLRFHQCPRKLGGSHMLLLILENKIIFKKSNNKIFKKLITKSTVIKSGTISVEIIQHIKT